MVELQHREIPTPALTVFVALHPGIGVPDFDSLGFQPVKTAVKADLNQDQGGLCVYCESKLKSSKGQVEHIKPKAGPNAHPHLCFTYTNYAHSCINPKTCGQKKNNGLLPIEPGPGCNADWTLSTAGTIEPIVGLNRNRMHQVHQTRDMLGLNKDSNLVDERRRWLKSAVAVLAQAPNDLPSFLLNAPFRHILATSI
ncbi:MAG: TIGR02646 family protein [Ferrovum myxofaciens]|uniref:retron system putative HNH endonuclease n=1 Tax=Ferrovum myxofaciens TaxID=416213 RepID=UPI002356AE67|nr:retron system putative HNH endonuclease [Ferrovum myxofaciens]QKE41937.1 MAG: TIGR02646 family protein [Ferrovum myxofaciens]